ncbi:MAG: chlorophyll synthase ChlG [Gemmatimonadaceae bacterium]
MTVTATLQTSSASTPKPSVVLELLKPVTWFPPMWAFTCGAVSSGAALSQHKAQIALGILLTGPLVCAASQAVNDWYDRDVDALNEPNRPIPSGRVPGVWGLRIAIGWTLISLAVGAVFGIRGFLAAVAANVLSWAYSAPPIRLKRNGWLGNAAVGLSYEGLAWITAAAILMAPEWPSPQIIALALLYSAGTHGIMTLNDFKSIGGDRQSGIRSLPVMLGPVRAGQVACLMMLVPQLVVIALLIIWNSPWYAAVIAALTVVQIPLMKRLLAAPKERAAWYNGTGVMLFVMGMMVSAFALRSA